MRLKRLELQGFKSFADKTEILFEDGITAVVGPNGSGKSNIADAIRWVLGEQSVKNLRGSKMGDVIFSGTQNRNPVGFCQVSLVFDNEDHWLQVDFSEVAVSRRYYKSGESEYSINKKTCRLKDILELFRDTGVGKEGYSIIGQGQITNILSTNSADRRTAFEAATGVLTYKTRKAEAEGRLNKTMENIIRLEDVLTEMSSNLESLEEQASAAKEFVACRDRLRELELSQFYYKHLQMDGKIQGFEQELEQMKTAMEGFDRQEEQLNRDRAKQQREIEELDEEQNRLQLSYTALHEEVLRHDSERQLFEQRQQTFAQDQERIARENGERLTEIGATEEKKKAVQERLTEQQERLIAVNAAYEKVHSELGAAKEEYNQMQSRLDELKQAKIDYLNSIQESTADTSRFQTMLENIDQRMQAIGTGREELTAKIDQMEQEKSGYDERVRAGEAKIEGKRQQIAQLQQERQQGKDRRYGLQQEIRELEIALGSLQSKIQLLTNLQTGYEGYFEAVKRLMQSKNNRALGTVADVITVPKEYITAVETALGNGMQNVITANENDAKAMIAFLKQNRWGRATFLPLTAVEAKALNNHERSSISRIQGVFGAACDLVEYEDRFDPVIKKLLGRTVVVDNLDTAIAVMKANHYKFTTVTLDGDIMYAGGAMTGGSRNNKHAGLLSRGEEIAELQQSEQVAAGKLAENKAEMERLQSMLGTSEGQITGLQQEIGAIEETFREDRDNQQTIIVQIASEQSKIDGLKEEAEQLADSKADIEAQLAEKTGAQPVAQVDEEELKRLSALASRLSLKQDELQSRLTEIVMEKTGIEKDIAGLEHDDGRYQRRIEKYRQEMEEAEEKSRALREQMESLSRQFESRTSQTGEQQQKEQQLKAQLEEMENRKKACQILSKECENKLEELREQNKQTLDRRFQLQMELEKLKMTKETASQEIFEKYDLTFEQMEPEGLLAQEEVKGREVHSLKNRIRAMGNVNLNAIDDYAELKARHTETSTQLNDLLESKSDLEDLIARLFDTMTKQFSEQFQRINDNFSKIFVELFGGGKAFLRLGEGNAMECDIEIEAQPPGKKLQTISLLSGGEKALTAIAILFAMLELKPTPFCVLDEIEAALDEANVYNFARYLANYSHDTQFIVITHRRGVMDSSNAIYGVAMQEKGISKVMSLKLEKEA